MIGLLDPSILLPRSGPDPSRTVCKEIGEIVRVCRSHNIRLLAVGSYWHDLWSTYGRTLEATLEPQARQALRELRKMGARHTASDSQVDAVAWLRGFRQLFGSEVLPDDWEVRMASAVVEAVSSGEQVVVFIRRVEGRNLTIHRVENSTLDENLRWVLYVQLPVIGPKQVLCVYNARNLTEPWTCRYDWRLPSSSAGAVLSFEPPHNWWKGSAVAWRTVRSKHAWIDHQGNGWCRPNISNGAGYHWDVFIESPAMQEHFGDSHLNIVAYDAPPEQGQMGYIHH